MRYLKLVAGEHPLGRGFSLQGPSSGPDPHRDPYQDAVDSTDPMTDPDYLRHVKSALSQSKKIGLRPTSQASSDVPVVTVDTAKRLLSVLRHGDTPSVVFAWSEAHGLTREVRAEIERVRALAGEQGPDPILLGASAPSKTSSSIKAPASAPPSSKVPSPRAGAGAILKPGAGASLKAFSMNVNPHPRLTKKISHHVQTHPGNPPSKSLTHFHRSKGKPLPDKTAHVAPGAPRAPSATSATSISSKAGKPGKASPSVKGFSPEELEFDPDMGLNTDLNTDLDVGAVEDDVNEVVNAATTVAGIVCASLNVVPAAGQVASAVCALAVAVAAAFAHLGTWISSATRDTFHPDPATAEAWLTMFRIHPGLVMVNVDNVTGPDDGARLVRRAVVVRPLDVAHRPLVGARAERLLDRDREFARGLRDRRPVGRRHIKNI